ncbi:enoyl-CoA hydratase/isomerase family protein [Herpetosiphon geysericola]|uniref:Enoyl-CoA hydratase n=1 Tax=Herpetosiphon geysericola TaxID=70996 RepID=A0A0P6YAM3_9CHLR|nr:enoyl-CoA hydratase-related protein [Herpetosiphon geysericola]KPL90326.1 enoyl-CoA hydratase [Herpetosiphon geysericola]
MAFENIVFEINEHVAVITVNRPKALNALNSATIRELGQAVDQLAQDSSVRALIITGAGEKAFVAGADISEVNSIESSLQGSQMSEALHAVLWKLGELPQVTIAAINGFALGGGFELALGCDIRLASEQAQVGLPEVGLGLVPGWGGALRVQRLAGTGVAKYLVLTGERISASEAQRLGLIEKIVPAAELLDEAHKLAAKVAKNAPLATALAKRLINRGAEMSLRDAIAYENGIFGQLCMTEDVKEGTSAFLEKRAAKWQGK